MHTFHAWSCHQSFWDHHLSSRLARFLHQHTVICSSMAIAMHDGGRKGKPPCQRHHRPPSTLPTSPLTYLRTSRSSAKIAVNAWVSFRVVQTKKKRCRDAYDPFCRGTPHLTGLPGPHSRTSRKLPTSRNLIGPPRYAFVRACRGGEGCRGRL